MTSRMIALEVKEMLGRNLEPILIARSLKLDLSTVMLAIAGLTKISPKST